MKLVSYMKYEENGLQLTIYASYSWYMALNVASTRYHSITSKAGNDGTLTERNSKDGNSRWVLKSVTLVQLKQSVLGPLRITEKIRMGLQF
jgi:hypothetical protein